MNKKTKYKSINDWAISEPNAYAAANRMGIIDSIRKEMGWLKPIKWDKSKCLNEAKKYKSKSEWIKNSESSYQSALKNKWLKECSKHMISVIGFWTKEKCLKEALKYNTRQEWRINHSKSYTHAKNKGYYKYCTKHMTLIKKANGFWTMKNCLIEAKKHKTKTEWQKNSCSSYAHAWKNNLMKECCKHMITKKVKPKGYWNFDNIKKEAVKYKNVTEWSKKSSSSYIAARRNGWLNKCRKYIIS